MKLKCPNCSRTVIVPNIEGDHAPEGTVCIETECEMCAVDFTSERYFDKDGKEIFAT